MAICLDDLESQLHSQSTTIQHLEATISVTIKADVHHEIHHFQTAFMADIHASISAQLHSCKTSITDTVKARKATEWDTTCQMIASAITCYYSLFDNHMTSITASYTTGLRLLDEKSVSLQLAFDTWSTPNQHTTPHGSLRQ